MAGRIIDADKLKRHYAWWKGGSREMTMDEAKSDFDTIIDLQPTVEPIKHGRWSEKHYCSNLTGYDYAVICSECERPTYRQFAEPTPNYCPNCGAKMEGGEE